MRASNCFSFAWQLRLQSIGLNPPQPEACGALPALKKPQAAPSNCNPKPRVLQTMSLNHVGFCASRVVNLNPLQSPTVRGLVSRMSKPWHNQSLKPGPLVELEELQPGSCSDATKPDNYGLFVPLTVMGGRIWDPLIKGFGMVWACL